MIENERFVLTDDRGPVAHGRGAPTATLVIDGEVRDPELGIVSAGEVLWGAEGEVLGQARVLRLWMVAAGETRAALMQLDQVPERKSPGARVRVISGRLGDLVAPEHTIEPLMMLDVHMATRSSTRIEMPGGHAGFAYVLSGPVSVATRAMREGDVAPLDDEGFSITAGPVGGRVLVYSAPAV